MLHFPFPLWCTVWCRFTPAPGGSSTHSGRSYACVLETGQTIAMDFCYDRQCAVRGACMHAHWLFVGFCIGEIFPFLACPCYVAHVAAHVGAAVLRNGIWCECATLSGKCAACVLPPKGEGGQINMSAHNC